MKKEIDHAQRAHSTLGASSAKRWFECPGSVALCEEIPTSPSTEAALEGTAAHELAETMLRLFASKANMPAASWYVGKPIADRKVTKDMAAAVQVFVDHVVDLVNANRGCELHIEKKFHLSHIHPKCYGTSDVTIVLPFKKVIAIDYKHGIGIPVEVEQNEQLLYYLLGASQDEDFNELEIQIVQPRCEHPDGPIRSWKPSPKYLMNFAKKLRQKALATEQPDAPLKAGEWCRFCPAAGVCPALHQTSIEVARADFAEPSPTLPTATKLTNEQIGRVIENKKLLEKWLDSVEEYAFARMQDGEKIPGVKFVMKQSRREWKDETTATKVLQRELGEGAFHPPKLLSVAQAEDLVGQTRLRNYWQRIDGDLTVAPLSDKRAEIIDPKNAFDALPISVDDF